MEIVFRKAELEDVEKIVDLCNECFDEKTDYTTAKIHFLSSSNDDNQIYIIGQLDNKIVAHTKITIIPTIFEGMGTYAILNHVCVKKEYRRHNIATHMLDKVSEICKQRNCKTIKLWSNNVDYRMPAHTCYKKYGFEVVEAKIFNKDL